MSLIKSLFFFVVGCLALVAVAWLIFPIIQKKAPELAEEVQEIIKIPEAKVKELAEENMKRLQGMMEKARLNAVEEEPQEEAEVQKPSPPPPETEVFVRKDVTPDKPFTKNELLTAEEALRILNALKSKPEEQHDED